MQMLTLCACQRRLAWGGARALEHYGYRVHRERTEFGDQGGTLCGNAITMPTMTVRTLYRFARCQVRGCGLVAASVGKSVLCSQVLLKCTYRERRLR
jgi:hypothetical protein